MLETFAAVLMRGSPFADLPGNPSPVCQVGMARVKRVEALLVLIHTWLQDDELHSATGYEDSDRLIQAQDAIANARKQIKKQSDRLEKICQK